MCFKKGTRTHFFGGKKGTGGIAAKSADSPLVTTKVPRTQLAFPSFCSILHKHNKIHRCHLLKWKHVQHWFPCPWRGIPWGVFVENFIVLAIICGQLICSPVRVYIPACDMIYFYCYTLWKGFLHDMFYCSTLMSPPRLRNMSDFSQWLSNLFEPSRWFEVMHTHHTSFVLLATYILC